MYNPPKRPGCQVFNIYMFMRLQTWQRISYWIPEGAKQINKKKLLIVVYERGCRRRIDMKNSIALTSPWSSIDK